MPVKNKKMIEKRPGIFSEDEQGAIRARMKEMATDVRSDKKKNQGEKDLLEAIAKMIEPDRTMARRLHGIVKKNAPDIWPKTWYGMPAYANKDGKIICFFQSAQKFKTRYATFGFQQDANLDDGDMWPVAFALKKLTDVEEAKIAMLVKKAVSR